MLKGSFGNRSLLFAVFERWISGNFNMPQVIYWWNWGWVKRGSKEHWLLGGSAKILDCNLAVAVGFGVVSLNLPCSRYRVNLHFSCSRFDLLPVFLIEVSWNMGFCPDFQRFSLRHIHILFIVGIWLLTRNNSFELSCPNRNLRAGGLQERRTVEAAKISQAKTD